VKTEEEAQMSAHTTRHSERGVVFLLALIALLVIAAVGAAILYMAASESGFVGAQRLSARSFYAGVGGLEEGKYRLLPGVQPGAGPLYIGINYQDPINFGGPGPIMPCTPAIAPNTSAGELTGTLVPCTTSSVTPGAPGVVPTRNNNVLYIINSASPAPAAPGADATQVVAPNNDPFLPAEIPTPSILTVGSIQPAAGTPGAVPWRWVRINLKTERASGEDIDMNAADNNDDEPIFTYRERQYRRPDLLAFDPTGAILPAPWGPPPLPGSGRMCVAPVCAAPVYLVTAYSEIPGVTPAGRVVRGEVGAGTGFSINAGLLSEPGIGLTGGASYIGYDQCDPGCPPGMPDGMGATKDTDPYTTFTGDPGFIPGCSAVLPVQSAAPVGDSTATNASARTYPNDCCPGCANKTSGGVILSCVQENAPFPYDVEDMIGMLRGSATPIPPGNYTGSGALSGIDRAGGGTYDVGTFPAPPYPGSLASQTGAGAKTKITYVGGDFKCTAGCKGAGILLVNCPTCTAANPALTIDGSIEWYGLIIVNGPVSVLGGGTPTSGCNIYGSMIAAGTVVTDVGGTICYRYNSCAQRDMFRNRAYQQLSFRELPD
jgi:hypothetical protein